MQSQRLDFNNYWDKYQYSYFTDSFQWVFSHAAVEKAEVSVTKLIIAEFELLGFYSPVYVHAGAPSQLPAAVKQSEAVVNFIKSTCVSPNMTECHDAFKSPLLRLTLHKAPSNSDTITCNRSVIDYLQELCNRLFWGGAVVITPVSQ